MEINREMSVNATLNSGFLKRLVGKGGKEKRNTCNCVLLAPLLLEFRYVNTCWYSFGDRKIYICKLTNTTKGRRMWDVGKFKFDNTAENNPRNLLRHFSDEFEWKRNTLTALLQVVGLCVICLFVLLLFVCFPEFFKSLAFECVSQ